MHFPQARWLTLLSTLFATVHAAVEVDLVFPRNETYSPSNLFPIVFAVQSTQSAELLNLRLFYEIRWGDYRNNFTTGTHDLQWVNWSSSADPYLAYDYVRLNTTRQWLVTWDLHWESCDKEALANNKGGGVFDHHFAGAQYFTTNDSAIKDVDLVAATANATCPNSLNAIAINVTDTIMHSPPDVNTARRDTCVVTVNSTSSATRTTPDPCRVAIDKKATESMAAAHRQKVCDPQKTVNRPDDCPAEENGAQKLALLGISCFLAAFGVISFVLL